ncbi:MAG: YdcF family protein [Rhizomicrobium sp.]
MASAVLQFTRHARIAKYLTLFTAVLLCAIIVLPVGQWMLLPLENAYPRPPLPKHVDGILVLSADYESSISVVRKAPPTSMYLGRLIGAAALARTFPGARVIFSGGSAAIGGGLSERAAAATTFDALGLGRGRVTYDERSRNTAENFRYAMALAHPKPAETWMLVTSAAHMPRAMRYARAIRWNLIPWASDYMTPRRDGFSLKSRLVELDAALREYEGLVAERLFG